MLAKIYSAGVMGVEAYLVEVELSITSGIPSYTLVGLPENSVKEGFSRVRSALQEVGVEIPAKRITVNLAPADVRKEGSAYDLPIAIGLWSLIKGVDLKILQDWIVVGELSLDGNVRSIRAVLPMALLVKKKKFNGILCPWQNRKECLLVKEMNIKSISSLKEVLVAIEKQKISVAVQEFYDDARSDNQAAQIPSQVNIQGLDLTDILGSERQKRALKISAAGGHSILLIGPPGTGKSMLAKRLPGILPPLSNEEALEVGAVYSSAGLTKQIEDIFNGIRPFRAPHHDASIAGLIGGGTFPRPGEISLAHHGVLFLDELPEFKKVALEALRQPLEDKKITIVRSRCSLIYPAFFLLIAAMNPCPCGYFGSQVKDCTCDAKSIVFYRSKISGPLLDRFDLHIEVPHISPEKLLSFESQKGEGTKEVLAHVIQARAIQQKRYVGSQMHFFLNTNATEESIKKNFQLTIKAEKLLLEYANRYGLSGRALYKALKVSRTIADLECSEKIEPMHLGEALSLRVLDRKI